MAITPGIVRTHHVSNPTGSTVTVNAQSVNAHSSAILTMSDSDAASFAAGGCKLAQLCTGVADQAHLVGYQV